MPMSIDVVLPADQEVTWPDLCPGCGNQQCNDLLPVAHRRTSWAALWWPVLHFFGKRRAFQVPICGSCRHQQIRSRWLRLAAILVIGTGVVFFVEPWLREQIANRSLRRLTFLAAVVVACAPVIALYVLVPAAVDITVGKKTISYEFARRDYADAFQAANRPRS